MTAESEGDDGKYDEVPSSGKFCMVVSIVVQDLALDYSPVSFSNFRKKAIRRRIIHMLLR